MNSEMEIPLVSVTMPVYNGEKYLKEAIDSVLNQSYKNIELIIVNDASTDSTKKIIHAYSDSRIRYVENETNSGIVYSRNRGVVEAEGEFVATLDSDDIAMQNRIEKQVDFLCKNPDFGMCGTFYHTIDRNGNFIGRIRYPTGNVDIITSMILGNCFGNSTIMIRSKIVKELKYRKGYDIAEDYDLWCRIAKIAKLANLPIYGTLYRVHGNNVSVARMNDLLVVEIKIIKQILKDMNVEFSEREFEIHLNFFKRNIGYFNNRTHFKELEDWLIKLYKCAIRENKYNPLLLLELIADKWMVIAFGVRQYGKLFYSRVARLNRGLYLGCLLKRVYSKVTR
jgi:glycosyltransferase involved in cell wall biosynthesis